MANVGRVGVVTVLYNSEEVLDDFFASLARQNDVNFKLYVIDNGATRAGIDKAERLAEQYGIDSEMVFNAANVGVAKGNNQGIALAIRDGCKYVLLANNDTDFPAKAISMLLQQLTGGEVAATPKILFHGPDNLVWFAGGHLNPWTTSTVHHGLHCADDDQFNVPSYAAYAPTCFMLLDVSVFERIGIMDESYFVYYDDTDFVWRLNAAGMRICYVPSSVVMHKVSSSTGGGDSPFSVYYTNRNRIYFIRKNLRGLQFLSAMFYVLLTRISVRARLQKPLAGRLWAGVKDGLRMTV